jgi:uncharacterized protein (DUF697 family)
MMLQDMSRLHNNAARSPFRRLFRLGLLKGFRSIEIDPEDFRRYLSKKHKLHLTDFSRIHEIPTERLDAVAACLIRDAERWALAEGAGLGLGGVLALLPDASLLTVITLRLIQRLCLLYGFEIHGPHERRELWLAAAAGSGIDFGKDLAEKEIVERLAPRIAERLALKMGQETAEKWVGKLIPVAGAVVGGTLNFGFVRAWGRRTQRHLRERHLSVQPLRAQTACAGISLIAG